MKKDVAIVILENSAGQFYTTKRAAEKYSLGVCSLGVGVTVEPGERPEEAAARELLGLGIEAKVEHFSTIPTGDNGTSHSIHAFKIRYDGNVSPSQKFECGYWTTPKMIDAMVDADALCPDTKKAYQQYRKMYLIS